MPDGAGDQRSVRCIALIMLAQIGQHVLNLGVLLQHQKRGPEARLYVNVA